MSGLFGIIRPAGLMVKQGELCAMSDALKHRGPDGIEYHLKENVGLGHCMLQSTPESLHEVLPYQDDINGLVITADARIDNRDELVPALDLKQPFEKVADSQIILGAYLKWGENCVDHLVGDFAFAIWDKKSESLFVARDHLGCKPFYYFQDSSIFVFASSALAISRVLGDEVVVSKERLADYLVMELECIDNVCTFFTGVSRLPPAHKGKLEAATFSAHQYWAPRPLHLSDFDSDEAYLDAFSEVYSEAVRARLRCVGVPASTLSGGLDSSTIVSIAREYCGEEARLRTFSAVSEAQANCPETMAILSIIEQGDLSASCATPADAAVLYEELRVGLQSIEDPFDEHMILPALMYVMASREGARVLLDGVDGDFALGMTLSYLSALLKSNQWKATWKEAHLLAQRYYGGYRSGLSLFLSALASRLVPESIKSIRRFLLEPLRYRKRLGASMASDELSQQAALRARFEAFEKMQSSNHADDLQERHSRSVHSPVLTAGIERYERVASYFGIEPRHPLLDKRVLEFCVALPQSLKVRDGWSKFLLREFASQRLPLEVSWREGADSLGWRFGSDFHQWVQEQRLVSEDALYEALVPDVKKAKLAEFARPAKLSKGSSHYLEYGNIFGLYNWLKRADTSTNRT